MIAELGSGLDLIHIDRTLIHDLGGGRVFHALHQPQGEGEPFVRLRLVFIHVRPSGAQFPAILLGALSCGVALRGDRRQD